MASMPLKSDMLNAQVYNWIKREILRGRIQPGVRLVDSQLAEYFGISRTPVRDAIFMLAREGLVENKGKRGFYVLEADARAIDELYEFRLIIETQAAASILARMEAGEDFTERFAQIEAQTAQLLKKGDTIGADECFHDSLVALMDNRRICKVYEEMRNQLRVFRQMTSEVDARVQSGIWFHEQILEALRLQNAARADRLIRDHIEKGRQEAHEDAGV